MAKVFSSISVDIEVRPTVTQGIDVAVWRVRLAHWLIALAERIGSCEVKIDVRLK